MTLTVVAPIPKAQMSVREVTVMDTPACFIVMAIRSWIGRSLYVKGRLLYAPMITNRSSTPIPVKCIM